MAAKTLPSLAKRTPLPKLSVSCRPAVEVGPVAGFYNRRGTAEQGIREDKHAIKWTRQLCQRYSANALRLQLQALAYNLVNFLRTLALPPAIAHW